MRISRSSSVMALGMIVLLGQSVEVSAQNRLGGHFGAVLPLAFDVNEPSWGFTPILNHGLLSYAQCRACWVWAQMSVGVF